MVTEVLAGLHSDKEIRADHEARAVRAQCQKDIVNARRAGALRYASTLEADLLERDGVLPPHLSDADYQVYEGFLPTGYFVTSNRRSTGTAGRLGYRELMQFAYGKIPSGVLELMNRAFDEWHFDELELRTPEVAISDPALFGRKGSHRYLLARWAESAEHLISFEEIKRRYEEGIKNAELRSAAWRLRDNIRVGCVGTLVMMLVASGVLAVQSGRPSLFFAGMGVSLLVHALFYACMRSKWEILNEPQSA